MRQAHTFTSYVKVRGQGRPRVDFTRRRTYKPDLDRSYEQKLKADYINSNGPHFGHKPLVMTIDVHRELPKSRPKRVTSEADVFKPDATNIAKAVEDALNGIAYYDDAQIVRAVCHKHERVRCREHLTVTIEEYEPKRAL